MPIADPAGYDCPAKGNPAREETADLTMTTPAKSAPGFVQVKPACALPTEALKFVTSDGGVTSAADTGVALMVAPPE
ncbi:MAG: hypothetical protein A3G34_17295 [Candidatus Lindowbacteria bacterium RIFCSPLOWO2_12_FULL_62_27]|nr:MAG: hypothetical protein A3G34_17295 [Candidatus Lindowbacteria bacterium RIFCSPLOWO2_12_FULL_62_27]OGH62193.1 MAG: hypothetical protein A3I06_01445 [Candidatus Lindowbacteria bacterium RIFCSPLOWO2_02_FULL_62_12]